MMRNITFLFLILLVLIATPINAKDLSPQNLCQKLIIDAGNVVIAKDDEERHNILSAVFTDRFATHEFLKSVLWKYWNSIDKNHQDRLEYLFPKMLTKNILKRLDKAKLEDVSSFKLKWLKDKDRKKTARFKGRVRGEDVAIDIFLIRSGGIWKIVDVTVQGANMRVNYEGQFGRIIDKEGIDELLRRVEDKAKQ